MRILIVRHGPAGDRDAWAEAGKDDGSRPLTAGGKAKMRRAAKGLATLVKDVDLVATSPLTRARETASILLERFPKARLLRLDALRPEADRKKVLDWLSSLRREGSVALVGHEPALGLLASRLLGTDSGSCLELKKGACALLEAGTPVTPGRAVLRWLLQPRHLRGLAP